MSLIENKKIFHEYTVVETFEAGAVLHGFEVKSLRAKQGKLEGSRIVVRGGEAFLIGASIPAWQPDNAPKDYDPERPRKLLLHTKELLKIAEAEDRQGLTAVPISWYNSKRMIKLSFGIVRGKRQYDKRDDIRKRDEKRIAERVMKYRK